MKYWNKNKTLSRFRLRYRFDSVLSQTYRPTLKLNFQNHNIYVAW